MAWSPTTLEAQRRYVRLLALRADADRRALALARDAAVARVREAAGSPLALVGSFTLGFLTGEPSRQRIRADGAAWRTRIRGFAAAALWLGQTYVELQRRSRNLAGVAARRGPH